MKGVIIIIIFLFFCFNVMAQELPEPSMPPISYEMAIAWGTKTVVQTWASIVPTSITVTAGVASTVHNYNGKIGDNTIEFTASDSTATTPIKVDAVISITSIPQQKPFDYFRIKVRAYMTIDGVVYYSDWSDASYWVSVSQPKRVSQLVNR